MKIQTITPAEVRRRAVEQWGEEKVAANEADVARRFGRNAPSTVLVEVVVVTCGCGFLPLNSHRTSAAAWRFAAEHVALNPALCTPAMGRDLVPAALAPAV